MLETLKDGENRKYKKVIDIKEKYTLYFTPLLLPNSPS